MICWNVLSATDWIFKWTSSVLFCWYLWHSIHAIGDCIAGPMLAHKAEDEGGHLLQIHNIINSVRYYMCWGHARRNPPHWLLQCPFCHLYTPGKWCGILAHVRSCDVQEVAWVGRSEEQLKQEVSASLFVECFLLQSPFRVLNIVLGNSLSLLTVVPKQMVSVVWSWLL